VDSVPDGFAAAFDALANVIPVLARTHQQSRAPALTAKRRELSTRLSEKKSLQVELVTAKVKGDIAQDDFDVVKASLTKDIAEIETALRTLSTDADSLAELTADTTRQNIPASALWGSVQLSERQTVQSALFQRVLCTGRMFASLHRSRMTFKPLCLKHL
jgi:hypothetical protein